VYANFHSCRPCASPHPCSAHTPVFNVNGDWRIPFFPVIVAVYQALPPPTKSTDSDLWRVIMDFYKWMSSTRIKTNIRFVQQTFFHLLYHFDWFGRHASHPFFREFSKTRGSHVLDESIEMVQYCTISIDSAVTRHTHFFLTPEIIFSRFFRFSEIFRKCEKVTCWPNQSKWYSTPDVPGSYTGHATS